MFKFKLNKLNKVVELIENFISTIIKMLNEGISITKVEVTELETKLTELQAQLAKAQSLVTKLEGFLQQQ